jgi:hypothetical protein
LKISKIIIIIWLILFASGCAKEQPELVTAQPSAVVSSPQLLDELAYTDTDDIPVDELKRWVGRYSFFETEYRMAWRYEINIYENEGSYYADVVIDDFQTMNKLRAKIKGDSNSIDFIFDSYLPENIGEPYIEGDVLFSFEQDGADILTKWGDLTAELVENQESGEDYFICI